MVMAAGNVNALDVDDPAPATNTLMALEEFSLLSCILGGP